MGESQSRAVERSLGCCRGMAPYGRKASLYFVYGMGLLCSESHHRQSKAVKMEGHQDAWGLASRETWRRPTGTSPEFSPQPCWESGCCAGWFDSSVMMVTSWVRLPQQTQRVPTANGNRSESEEKPNRFRPVNRRETSNPGDGHGEKDSCRFRHCDDHDGCLGSMLDALIQH